MIDYKLQASLLRTIKKIIKVSLKKLAFNNCIEGIISNVNTNNTYNVKVDEKVYENIKTVNSNIYTVNDVVWLIKINNDLSYLYIFCKV